MVIHLNLTPPTVTAQEHKFSQRFGRTIVYDPPRLRQARKVLMTALAAHAPKAPMEGALYVAVSWRFPATKRHPAGTWRTTRPDTDNLQKLLKDCMTRTGYWHDDAQVCAELVEKWWSDKPGIYIKIEPLPEETTAWTR